MNATPIYSIRSIKKLLDHPRQFSLATIQTKQGREQMVSMLQAGEDIMLIKRGYPAAWLCPVTSNEDAPPKKLAIGQIEAFLREEEPDFGQEYRLSRTSCVVRFRVPGAYVQRV